jgi:hypothetical protein
MANAATFVGTPRLGLVQIVNADASAQKTVLVAGAAATKVASLLASSTDTSARVLTVSILRSAVNYVLGAMTVPITAGTDGVTATTNLLSLIPGLPVDNDGQPYVFLAVGDTLQVSSGTTVTAAKAISISAIGGDF